MNEPANEPARETTDETIREIRDELGGDLRRVARADGGGPRLRAGKLAALAATLAFAAGGAGIAIAAAGDEEPSSDLPPPSLEAVGSTSGEKLVEFQCEAHRQWFFEEVGFDGPAFNDPDAALPDPPEGICD